MILSFLAYLAILAPASGDTAFAPVARVVQRGIQRGAVPSAYRTRWDLASLTKVVATTSALLVLADRGRIALDAPVFHYLPRFAGDGRERVMVRMLLDHTSGLPPYLPLYRAAGREAALDQLFRTQLRHVPGTVTEYSDLNAILLGLLVETATGQPLDQFTAREVFSPLGMAATAFAPELPRGASVAPSRRIGCCAVPGRVNDDNAFFLGGVAGHAGLYSTGLDLARFAQTWLREGTPPGGANPWVSAGTLQQFLNRANDAGRALGWDTPVPREDSSRPGAFGNLICACAFGHTGWTGTMLWIDPSRDLFLVFLTNRSLQPRLRNSIGVLQELRHELSDRVLEIAPVLTATESGAKLESDRD
ncbi:MAG: serine hydrolase domain-containing protein [Gemmatimonadales bacterium]